MISLILPAYNEEALIQSSLTKLNEFASEEFDTFEIIVVDDGSTDKTGRLIKEWQDKHWNPKLNFQLLNNPQNRGKGFAIRRGMQIAKGEMRIFIDSDLPFELSVLPKLISRLEKGFDIVIGNRNAPDSVLAKNNPVRRMAGKMYSCMVQFLLKNDITDTQCGIKGFNKAAAEKIFSRILIDGFGFDVEVLYIAGKLGLKIEKVPVRMTSLRSESRVHILKDSIEMFGNLFTIKRNDAKGLYQ